MVQLYFGWMITKHYISTFELMKRVKKDDSQAFRELFDRLWEVLFSYAKSILMDEDLAKDVVQEVWVDFWQRRNQIDNVNIEGYLRQSTKFSVYKELQRNPLKAEHLQYLETVPSTIATDDELIYSQTKGLITSSVEELPSRCKEIFKMSREQQLSNAEIAIQLNISKRTVETQISNALKSLKLRLSTSGLGIFL